MEALPETRRRWLLTPTRPHGKGPLADYLAQGGAEFKVLDRHLVKQRVTAGRKWYAVEAHFSAPILFTYFNRPKAGFVRNLADAVPLNNWLVIAPHDDVDADAPLHSADEREGRRPPTRRLPPLRERPLEARTV